MSNIQRAVSTAFQYESKHRKANASSAPTLANRELSIAELVYVSGLDIEEVTTHLEAAISVEDLVTRVSS